MFTLERADVLVNAIGDGLSPKEASRRAGISITTFRNWVDRNVGGIAPRIAEAQLRAAALLGTPIKTTQRRPAMPQVEIADPTPKPTAAPAAPAAAAAAAGAEPPTATKRPPDINIRVTWEITPSGAAAIADVIGKLDRLGALAIALNAIFPNAGSNPEILKLLNAISAAR